MPELPAAACREQSASSRSKGLTDVDNAERPHCLHQHLTTYTFQCSSSWKLFPQAQKSCFLFGETRFDAIKTIKIVVWLYLCWQHGECIVDAVQCLGVEFTSWSCSISVNNFTSHIRVATVTSQMID